MIRELIGKVIELYKNRLNNYNLKKFRTVGKACKVCDPIKIIGGNRISIGNEFYAGPGCRLEAWENYGEQKFAPQIEIGDKVKINSKCHIGAINKIKIGNNVLFGSNVFITDHSHGNVSVEEVDIPPNERELYSKGPVVIEDNCWICENVIILPGVHVGYSAILAAGAYAVAAGNPARIVKVLKEN